MSNPPGVNARTSSRHPVQRAHAAAAWKRHDAIDAVTIVNIGATDGRAATVISAEG